MWNPFQQTPQAEQQDILALFHLKEHEVQIQDERAIPWHCGWCQPYVAGATTGICAECEEKHFPRRKH